MDDRSRAVEIASTLRKHGYRALLAGGCVRDFLLGRPPKDFDVATDARPQVVQKLFEKTYAVGAQFGVIVVLQEGIPFEVATFRADGSYLDGRHPSEVRFGNEVADARRRDFTINGLFLDPETGALLDYVGGIRDAAAGVVRTIGDAAERFDEDHLRVLRAVRFAAQLDFQLEKSTAAAVRDHAAKILTVSHERVRDELLRILVSPRADRGLRLLHEMALLGILLPEVEAMVGTEQPREFHPEGDVFTHVCLMLSRMRNPSIELAMGVLLHDVGKPPTLERLDRIRFNRHAEVGARMAKALCERFRFSRRQTDRVEALVAGHMKFVHVRDMRESRLRRFLAQDGIEEHLELHRLDCLASHAQLDNYEYCLARLEAYSNEPRLPRPLLTGDDLIAAGYVPGPDFTKMLALALDAQLEGKVGTREEALALVQKCFMPSSGRRK